MKIKLFAATLLATAVASCTYASADAESIVADKNTMNIVVDAKRVESDSILYNGTTYVPLRRVAEMLGKKVEWIAETGSAKITDGGDSSAVTGSGKKITEEKNVTLSVTKNAMQIFVGDSKVEADNFLYNDTTYVPIRRVAEMLNKDVSWDRITNTAVIGKNRPSVFDGNVIGNSHGIDYTDKMKNDYLQYLNSGLQEGEEKADENTALEYIKNDCAMIDIALKSGISAGVEFENLYGDNIAALESMDPAQFESRYGCTVEFAKYTYVASYMYSKLMALPQFAPTEDEIKDFYTKNLDLYFVYNGVRAKHILISPAKSDDGSITDAAWKEAEKKANDVYKLATSGSNFDELIKEYGEDPGMSANPNGYTFGKGEMVSEFEDACYSMKPGEISKPVKSTYGYHIIKLEEQLPYYSLEDAYETIAAELAKQKLDAYIESYK